MNNEDQRTQVRPRTDTRMRAGRVLCCCLAVDADGNYEDPCYRPAADKEASRCPLARSSKPR